jgi:hypothetical protein
MLHSAKILFEKKLFECSISSDDAVGISQSAFLKCFMTTR